MSAPTVPKGGKTVGSKSKDKYKAVKLARDLVSKAKVVADTRGLTIADYLSGVCRQQIERDFPRAVKEMERGDEGEGQA